MFQSLANDELNLFGYAVQYNFKTFTEPDLAVQQDWNVGYNDSGIDRKTFEVRHRDSRKYGLPRERGGVRAPT